MKRVSLRYSAEDEYYLNKMLELTGEKTVNKAVLSGLRWIEGLVEENRGLAEENAILKRQIDIVKRGVSDYTRALSRLRDISQS